jgi:MFS family permease
VSRRGLLIGLRVTYALLAASLAFPSLAGSLPIEWVFVVAAVSGLVRPSEMILRQSLIADSVPRELLTSALGFGRTTQESARVAGPLIGAALYSAFGIGHAYLWVMFMYLMSVVASLAIPRIPSHDTAPPANPWRELIEGVRYIRGERVMVGCLLLAFLVNVTAFPITTGLMPVIARDVFATDENGLARMLSLVAVGALAGSVLVAVTARRVRPERLMVASMCLWHALIIAFALVDSLPLAYGLLVLIGLSTTGAMVPVAALLMGQANPPFRGRVMGVRMLAVYGLPLGLLAAGAIIEWLGINTTVIAFGTLGLLAVAGSAFVWRQDLTSG